MKTKRMLNTAGRLIGGIVLGGLALVAMRIYMVSGGTVVGGIPDNMPWLAATMFFVASYRNLGEEAGLNGKSPAIAGIRSAFWGMILTSIVFAFLIMGRAFSQGQYFDPFKAVFDWIRTIFDVFVQGVTSPIILTALVLGGAICGIIVAGVNQRWR